MTYTYDTWGNITEKKIYAYTTATNPGTPSQTIPYVYSTGTWKDQLTSYNGQTISYDAMGNPTSYRGKTLTWNGKELTGVTGTASYTYDMNGLRTTKTVGGTTTDYFYNNTVLMGLTTGTTYLLFSYDASGLVQAVNYNGTYYYYLRNGQGDIVKLIDGSGNAVVEYTYDSWGKQLSCTGTLATTLGVLNPFRYRGYVYDEETGFYYLKSRYYDPETCRFISADVLLSTGQGVLGNNAYVYCGNNPALLCDETGSSFTITIFGVTLSAGEVALLIILTTIYFDLLLNRDQSLPYVVAGATIEGINSLLSGISSYLTDLADRIDESSRRKYSGRHELHHVVMRTSTDEFMTHARERLYELQIPIDSPDNLVSISTALHKPLHTRIYKVLIGIGVELAYQSGDTIEMKRQAVIGFLRSVKGILKAASNIIELE